MCLLFETIKIAKGLPQNVGYHIDRVKKTRLNLFNNDDTTDFEKLLSNLSLNSYQTHKLKVIYSKSIIDYQVSEYTIIPKKSIVLFEIPEIRYNFKFVNRRVFEEIENGLNPDELGIITQNGYLTDATYANIVLFDGVKYYTPDNCLLEGTKRAQLISQKKICKARIHINELKKYKYLQIINAMIELEDDIKIYL